MAQGQRLFSVRQLLWWTDVLGQSGRSVNGAERILCSCRSKGAGISRYQRSCYVEDGLNMGKVIVTVESDLLSTQQLYVLAQAMVPADVDWVAYYYHNYSASVDIAIELEPVV